MFLKFPLKKFLNLKNFVNELKGKKKLAIFFLKILISDKSFNLFKIFKVFIIFCFLIYIGHMINSNSKEAQANWHRELYKEEELNRNLSSELLAIFSN